MNILKLTLAELLAHNDQTVYRSSMSILKRLQRITDDMDCDCNKNYGNKDLQGSHDIDCVSRTS